MPLAWDVGVQGKAGELVSIGCMDAFRGKGDDLVLGLSTMAGTLVATIGGTRTVVVARTVIDGGSGRILSSRWNGPKAEHPAFVVPVDRNRAC